MSGLKFNEDAARQLERVYLTTDVVAQRAETMKQLALSPGERVLDIGSGPGFPDTLSGPALSGFRTRSGSGVRNQIGVTVGIFYRF